MSHHHHADGGELLGAIRAAVEAKLPGAECAVAGGGGHYRIEVVSSAFAGLSTLERHRLVLSAVAPLMKGADAPLHAVDSLITRTP